MQTQLADFIKDTPEGREADAILRACVHCGFCLATCPTYQLLGDELDSPRGRIYLVKQLLEGGPVSEKTQLHLDRCLTCRACESTCPSGVKYSRLADVGRALVERQVGRSPWQGLQRRAMRAVLPNARIFGTLLGLGRTARLLLPAALKRQVPPARPRTTWPAPRHPRTVLVLDGCVQPSLEPNINAAAARLLDRLGISLVRAEKAGCCGALSHHLNAREEGLDQMRRNIDAWWPYLEQGAEAVLSTASGCGAEIKEYGHLLRHDPAYAEKAARVSARAKDVAEVLLAEQAGLARLLQGAAAASRGKVAFHAPCSLQHGQRIVGVVEGLLRLAGFQLTPVPDGHLCCGSAGTYSLLQPEISRRLAQSKAEALASGAPDLIATANIGCLLHIRSATPIPVRHWVELVDEVLAG